MTPSEWLACEDPDEMFALLGSRRALVERKLRLFAAACCRRVWHRLDDERSRRAVEVLERYADGQAGSEELQAAESATSLTF